MKYGAKALSAVCVVGVFLATLPVTSRATDQDEIKSLQQQMQEMAKKLEALQQKEEAQEAAQKQAAAQAKSQSQSVAGTAGPPSKAAPQSTADSRFDKFMKGFFGTLDLSVDYTTKGMEGMQAFPYGYASGAPGSPFVITGPAKAGPYGKVGWLGAMSSNGSNIGYRGTHQKNRLIKKQS